MIQIQGLVIEYGVDDSLLIVAVRAALESVLNTPPTLYTAVSEPLLLDVVIDKV